MTIVEAAQRALSSPDGPAGIRESMHEIVRLELFEFAAKDRVSGVGAALRRRMQGSKSLRGEASLAAGPLSFEREVALGLLGHLSSIGTRLGWAERLEALGPQKRGHRVIKRKS